jgi:hypothetical protein
MRTSSESAEANPSDAVGTKWPPAPQSASDDQTAWLDQARKVRDQALSLMRERFAKDLELAEQLVGGTKPEALAREAEYGRKLTAEYLAETEKLFALTHRLLRKHPRSRESS